MNWSICFAGKMHPERPYLTRTDFQKGVDPLGGLLALDGLSEKL